MALQEVLQGAEYLVAKFLIKVQRLKIKCIQVSMFAAALDRFGLGKPHQLSSIPASTELFGYPQQADKEPAPERVAVKPANYLVLLISQEKTKLAQVELFNMGFVEINQVPLQYFDISFGRRVFHCDPVLFFIHSWLIFFHNFNCFLLSQLYYISTKINTASIQGTIQPNKKLQTQYRG